MSGIRVPFVCGFLSLALSCPAKAEGPYCGIYCVYGALRAAGIDPVVEELIDQKYLAGPEGSGITDLCRAITDQGCDAVPLYSLSESAFRSISAPVILHVRRPGYGTSFSHWVLILGFEESGVRVLDPPGAVNVIPMAELLATTDGVGVAVYHKPEWPVGAFWGGFASNGILLLWMVTLTSLFRVTLTARRGYFLRPPLIVTAVVCLSASAYQILVEASFLRNPVAVGDVLRRRFEPPIPSIELNDLKASIGRSDATLIDCRLPGDYKIGHIPKAIGLSISLSPSERVKVLASVPEAHKVVLYCQSKGCDWSRQMAGDLYYRGYHNIAVYKGGYAEWAEHERRRTAKP